MVIFFGREFFGIVSSTLKSKQCTKFAEPLAPRVRTLPLNDVAQGRRAKDFARLWEGWALRSIATEPIATSRRIHLVFTCWFICSSVTFELKLIFMGGGGGGGGMKI